MTAGRALFLYGPVASLPKRYFARRSQLASLSVPSWHGRGGVMSALGNRLDFDVPAQSPLDRPATAEQITRDVRFVTNPFAKLIHHLKVRECWMVKSASPRRHPHLVLQSPLFHPPVEFGG